MNVRAIVTLLVCTLLAPSAALADLSKEECIDAHTRGQEARDSNKLSLARKLFLTCAQSSCPALVQGDCARFVEDLTRTQPTVSFAARDGSGADLPDTTVYVDEALVATRLDDGRAYDVDPGAHTIKFVHGDVTRTTTIVLNNGEKGRTVVVTFPGGESVTTGRTDRRDTTVPMKFGPSVSHPTGAKVLIGAGAVMLVGGAAWSIFKFSTVPDECSFFDNTCQGTPGTSRYDDASSAAQGVNIGLIVTGVGAAALIGGIVWYVKGGKVEQPDPTGVTATPWIGGNGTAGITFSGQL
jgi:hypothetical protein